MKKVEIGYNFDLELIDYIAENRYHEYISGIYTIPFKDDYGVSTRKYLTFSDVQNDRKLYEEHINKITSNNLSIILLLQDQEHVLTKEVLEYYVNLGIKKFTVQNDDTAKMIKEYDSNLEIIASITKRLSYNDFMTKVLSMYDKFVLFFPFNRSLDTIKKLPQSYKYILLLNSPCGYTCPATFHWFSDCDENGHEIMPNYPVCQSGIPNQMIQIFYNDMDLFDPYITEYKLVGREVKTEDLKLEIEQFISRSLLTDNNKLFYSTFIEPVGTEKYYNVATGMNSYLN
jgi:hypothetical protein